MTPTQKRARRNRRSSVRGRQDRITFSRRDRIERLIETLIALLDAVDGDDDRELDFDYEDSDNGVADYDGLDWITAEEREGWRKVRRRMAGLGH